MTQPVVLVDSFTDAPFRGNPAGVCVLSGPTTEDWMQAVAAELNAAETAFAVPRDDGDHDLRWFTPTTEISLCGHATLATTHVLGGEHRFHTQSGVLSCRHRDDGAIEMDFPAIASKPVEDPPDWGPALGLGSGRVVGVRSGPSGWMLAELADSDDVRAAVPDRTAILRLGGSIIAVAFPEATPGVDSVCRVFLPGAGIDEDPVTGAAHCLIAPWLAERTGRTELVGEQASARGGLVGMRFVRGGDADRVILSGRAVTVLEGTLRTDPPAPG